MILVLGTAAAAHAQGLPAEPISFGGGRVLLAGEITATRAPSDPGFFNYTDYQYNTLRNVRLDLTAELRAHARVQLLSEIRVDRGEPFEPYGLYVRIRPWLSRRIDIQVGRVPPTFGAFGRNAYGSGNLLIGYPLAYQYLTSLRSDAVPATADELLRMRGRGWLVNYSVGNPERLPGLPLVNAFRWDTGLQVHGVAGAIEWTGSVTTGSLSNPRVSDDNRGRQWAGRVVLRPTASLAIGTSVARGAFLSRSLEPAVGRGAVDDAHQRGVGVDVEYSAGRFIGRGEMIWSQWTMPVPLSAGGPLRASSPRVEARYRLLPGVHVAARAEHLGFSRVAGATRRDRWDAPVTRFEAGAGWSIQRNLMVKGSWQRNLRNGGRVRHDTLGAAQVVYWF